MMTTFGCVLARFVVAGAIVSSAAGLAANSVALGLTDYVDDENPLWATLDAADGRIGQLGGGCGTHVTAGLYWLPAQRPAEPARRDYRAPHDVGGARRAVLECAGTERVARFERFAKPISVMNCD